MHLRFDHTDREPAPDPAAPSVSCREPNYADGKPRPLCRGVLHGSLSAALLAGVFLTAAMGFEELCLGLAGKMITYFFSACFHLYPFRSVAGVTRAFVADIACVPFAVCGATLAFVTKASFVREACIAAGVVVANGIAVAYQTHGQVGLETRKDRSDAPRSLIVALYSIWSSTFIGLSAGFGGLWPPMVAFALLAGLCSGPVSKAHKLEPTLAWARWHRLGFWSLHEDFHLVLALSDSCWLALAIQFEMNGRAPAVTM